MHGEHTTIKNWEWHFQKLQHRQSLAENNQHATENSKSENCNKKIKNDAGSSQAKSYDKQKVQLLNKITGTTKMQAIPEREITKKHGPKNAKR